MNTPAAVLDFEVLAHKYYLPLYRFALSLSGTLDTASDLTQQTFYVALRKGHQVQEADKIKSWLFTVLYRVYLRQHRRDSHFVLETADELIEVLPEMTSTQVNRIESEELFAALASLDDLHRVPLVLFYLEDMSYRDIAKFLGVPIGTVMSRLARAKAQLRRRLAEHEPQQPVN